jgi:hypothetical protein
MYGTFRHINFISYISKGIEYVPVQRIPEPPLRVDRHPTDGGSGVVGTPGRGYPNHSPRLHRKHPSDVPSIRQQIFNRAGYQRPDNTRDQQSTHGIPEPPLRVDMPPTDGGSGVVGTPRRGTYDFSPPGDRRDEEEIYVATSSPRKSPWADDENIPPLPYDENITADDENMRLSPPSIFARPINRTSPRKRPRADDENMRFSPPSIFFQSINRTSPGKRPRADDELQLGTRLRFSPPSILPFNLSSHSSPGEPPLA